VWRKPPLPLPLDWVLLVAENGATRRPFSLADLGRMASEGELTRGTLVWTPGAQGWTKAEEFPELAQLFTVAPPPPPPPAAG
jgi:hypothetical protein